MTALKEIDDNECGSSREVRKNKPYRKVTMYVPPTLPIKEVIIEKSANIKAGIYESIDQIMRSISEKIFSKRSPMAGLFSHGK